MREAFSVLRQQHLPPARNIGFGRSNVGSRDGCELFQAAHVAVVDANVQGDCAAFDRQGRASSVLCRTR